MRLRPSRLLGVALTLVSLAFLGWLARSRAAELPQIEWTAPVVGGLAAGTLLYLLGLLLGGLALHLILGAARSSVAPSTAVALLLRTNVGKYLPGNVGHLLGRAVLARELGIPTPTVVASLVFEAAAAALAALVMAALGLAADRRLWTDLAGELPAPGKLVVGLALLTGAALAATFLPRLLARRLPASVRHRSGRPGVCALAGATGLYGLNFCLYGGTAVLVIASGLTGAAGEVDFATWLRYAAALALAWVVGFLTPGSPGGLGVREAVLVVLLAPTLEAAPALVLALVLRLVTVVGDGLGLVLSFARPLRRKTNPEPSSPAPPRSP